MSDGGEREKRQVRGVGALTNWWDKKITVCLECGQASCWQGKSMCDESKTAGTTQRTIRQLILDRTEEHPSYWMTDEELAAK